MEAKVMQMMNTTQELPCVICGSLGNIVREAPNPHETRVKCNSCGHTYSKQDSLDAKQAGAIPDAPPENVEKFKPIPTEEVVPPPLPEHSPSKNIDVTGTLSVPRTPAFVFVSKDRKTVQFCTKKDLKKTALQWETLGKRYDMFELQAKKVSAKIEFN